MDTLRLQFLEKVRFFEELREFVVSKIQLEIRSNPYTPIKYFKTRIKSFERFHKKLIDDGISETAEALSVINDILGTRIICLYKNELQEVCDWVEVTFEKIDRKIFLWDGLGDLKPSGEELQRTLETGYTSIHYIVRLKESQMRTIDSRRLDLREFKFEIQVRTILEEAWGEFTHSVYEDKEAPSYIVKSYQILSEYLNILNKQVEFLRSTYGTLSKEQITGELVESQEFENKRLLFLDFSNFTLKTLKFLDCECFTFDLRNSDLYNVEFNRCSMMNFDFTNGKLRRLKFINSRGGSRYMMNFKLKATIELSKFKNSDMMNTDFGNVICRNTTFEDVHLMNTDLFNANFEKCKFKNVEFMNVLNLKDLRFLECTFDQVATHGENSEELKVIIKRLLGGAN
jgi:ppGpp synthetase/RelA/SpoT-type nucleotidyltranferase